MTWTCEQTELYLTDYLDGLLQPEQQHDFDLHVNSCERCAPLVASVTHTIANLRALPELETPPRFVYNLLDATLGPRDAVTGWGAVHAWLRGLASPRVAYGSVSVAASFLMLVTASGFNWKKPRVSDLSPANIYRNTNRQAHLAYARGTKYVSDLRVVYEIQSRLHQENELPANSEGGAPQSAPKEPGRTDGTTPATPRQQNRANDINSHLQVLAQELPVLTGKFCFGPSGKISLALSGKFGLGLIEGSPR
jgi:anti-sigma factor RsiW